MKLIDPRTGMQVLDRDACLRLLAQHQSGVGRLAMIDDARPTIVVVNYAMVEDRILFKSGPGTKLDVAANGGNVAFEIDHIDEVHASGWSVVVHGHAEVVTSKQQLFMLQATVLRPYVARDTDTWVMVHPDAITGRMVPTGSDFSF